MSEVRLVVREEAGNWSGTIHASCADSAIAALSADPVTLEELESAVARFVQPTPPARFFANLSAGLCDEPYDAGLVVIDLIAQLVFVDSTWSSPGSSGEIAYHDGHSCTEVMLRYHLADDWQFVSKGSDWRSEVERLRKEHSAKPVIDARAVFYGRPLLEFIARECLLAFGRRDEIAAEVRSQQAALASEPSEKDAGPLMQFHHESLTNEELTSYPQPEHDDYNNCFYDTIRQIHASWMLTPREDLRGLSPREFSFERHDHVARDLQARRDQWSRLNACPPGLAKSSHAFRYGGFGTHERVEYYELVRELLWSCWDHLTEMAKAEQPSQLPEALSPEEFVSQEIPRLEQVRESWLDTPDPEFHGRTPRSMIDRERARIPEAVSGHEAMIDPDCPCCQMMSEMPGPMFWHLDGCNQDEDFAFDLFHASLEEWEADQREWEEHHRKFNLEWAERERLGVTDYAPERDSSTWSRSFSLGDHEIPIGIRIFSLGCELAELIVQLRGEVPSDLTPTETQTHIDQLNRNFGNLRDILQNEDSSLTAALLEPALHRFDEALNILATDRPDLAESCEALSKALSQLLDPPSLTSEWGDGDHGDSDLPF